MILTANKYFKVELLLTCYICCQSNPKVQLNKTNDSLKSCGGRLQWLGVMLLFSYLVWCLPLHCLMFLKPFGTNAYQRESGSREVIWKMAKKRWKRPFQQNEFVQSSKPYCFGNNWLIFSHKLQVFCCCFLGAESAVVKETFLWY